MRFLNTIETQLVAASREISVAAGAPTRSHRARRHDTRHIPQVRFVRAVLATRRGWIAVAGAAGAAVIAALVFTAGAAPSAAQALPILATKTIDLRGRGIVAPRGIVKSALADAHSFSEPFGTGYVMQAPTTTDVPVNMLCVAIPPGSGTGSSIGFYGCAQEALVQGQGHIFPFDTDNAPDDGVGVSTFFVALVPVGGSLTVTAGGTTTAVPVTNGIASGVIPQSETLTLQVGSTTTTEQVTPNTQTIPQPVVSQLGSTGATGATS